MIMRAFLRVLPVIVVALCSGYERQNENFQLMIDNVKFAKANPCVNFQKYACGIRRFGWTMSHDEEVMLRWIVESENLLRSNEASNSRAVRKARAFFRACVDYSDQNIKTDFVNGVKRLLRMFSVNGKEVKMNLTSMLVETRLLSPPMLNVYVQPDLANKSRNIITLHQSTNTVVEPFYLHLFAHRHETYESYINEFIDNAAGNLTTIAKELGVTLNYNAVRRDINDVLLFQSMLDKLQIDNYGRQQQTTIRRLKVSEFNMLFPLNSFSLSDYLHSVVPPELHSFVNSDPEILVSDVKYFEGLVYLLNKTPPEVIINYFILIYARNAFLPKLRIYWYHCAMDTAKTLPFAIRALSASKHFDRKYKETAEHIGEDIRSTVVEMLQGIDLANQELKQRLTDIVSSMRFEIGYPEWILNITEVDNFYDELDINESHSFGEMKTIYAAWETRAILSDLAVPDDRKQWFPRASQATAQYIPSQNRIRIPEQALKEALFSPDLPMSVNYGSVGTMIAQEIMRGLGTMEVREISVNGTTKIHRLWDANATIHVFERCLRAQLFSALMTHENSADTLGVAAAFRALEKKFNGQDNLVNEYSRKQLFYISYAESFCNADSYDRMSLHTTNNVRVNTVLRNQKAFADVFQCPSGDWMNPTNKCQFW